MEIKFKTFGVMSTDRCSLNRNNMISDTGCQLCANFINIDIEKKIVNCKGIKCQAKLSDLLDNRFFRNATGAYVVPVFQEISNRLDRIDKQLNIK